MTVMSAARVGAAMWVVYGLLESALVAVSPAIRDALVAARPNWFVDRGGSPGDLWVALPSLFVYLLAGLASGALGALAVRATPAGTRWSRSAPAPVAARDLAALSVIAAFGIHAWHVHEWQAVTAATVCLLVSTTDLVIVWRQSASRHWSTATHPVTVLAALLAASFAGEIAGAPGLAGRSLATAAVAAGVPILTEVMTWPATLLGHGRLATRGRRVFPVAAWAVLILFTLGWLQPDSPGTAGDSRGSRPNVILITLDTVRADHLSLYGYPRDTTPFLAQLPATVYERAMASSNWTLPSHASMMTGRTPRHHGAHNRDHSLLRATPIARGIPTLAETLAANGYRTSAVVANIAFLHPELGISRGFASYDLRRPHYLPGLRDPRYLLSSAVRNAISRWRGAPAPFVNADDVNERAGRLLQSAARSREPFFLWLNYMDAHTPYVPPAPFDTRYPGKAASFDWAGFPALVEEVSIRRQRNLAPAEVAHLTSQYDGALAYLDDRLGRLFLKLKTLGLYDNSLVIVTADHGEAFGESSIVEHGLSVYSSQVWVPLIVKYPGTALHESVNTVVSSVDILPTVLDVVGLPLPGPCEGRSLRARNARPRWVTSESYRPRTPAFSSGDARPDEMAVYSGRWKLIVGAGGGRELYDLQADPFERQDLARLHTVSPVWLNWAKRAMNEAATGVQPEELPPVDADRLDRLRALGYVR